MTVHRDEQARAGRRHGGDRGRDVTVDALRDAVPGFPTVSEVWLRRLEKLEQQERS